MLTHWALSSLPSYLSTVVEDKDLVKLLKKGTSSVSEFGAAAVLVSDKVDMPSAARAIGYKYRDRIAFGYIWSEKSTGLLQRLGVEKEKVPSLIVFCDGDESRTVRYDNDSFKFEDLDKFLETFKSPATCAHVRPQHMEIDVNSVDVSKMKLGELKRVIASYGANCDDCIEKSDFVKKVQALVSISA